MKKTNFKRVMLVAAVVSFVSSGLNAQSVSESGYCGNVGLGYCYLGSTNYADGFEIETVYGYNFNRHLFVGGGMGLHMFGEKESTFTRREGSVEIPVFADLKVSVGKRKLSWFADIRAGVYTTESATMLTSGMLGCRIPMSDSHAINVFLGLEQLELTYQEVHYTSYKYKMVTYTTDENVKNLGIGLKVCYEF